MLRQSNLETVPKHHHLLLVETQMQLRSYCLVSTGQCSNAVRELAATVADKRQENLCTACMAAQTKLEVGARPVNFEHAATSAYYA